MTDTAIWVAPERELDMDDPDDINEHEVMQVAGDMLRNEDGSVMETIPACRKIKAEWQCANVQGLLMDGTTAHCILTVYDAINEANQAKLEEIGRKKGPAAIADICWKLVK